MFTEENWLHFASRPSLDSFTLLSNVLTQAISTKLRDCISHPFQSLTSLDCCAESAGFVTLLPFLPGLHSLQVHVVDASTHIISSIASKCPLLQSLAVVYEVIARCNGSELEAVAKQCKALRTFHIEADTPFDGSFNITDTAIENFTKLLPGLKYCSLNLPCELTEASLKSLGRNCRGLEEILFPGSVRWQDFKNETEPLFPKLREAKLFMRCRDPGNHSMDEIRSVLQVHAPALERIESGPQQGRMDRWVAPARTLPIV